VSRAGFEPATVGDIPRKLHDVIKPFVQQDLDITATQKDDSLILTLTPAKTFWHAKNTPQKTAKENT